MAAPIGRRCYLLSYKASVGINAIPKLAETWGVEVKHLNNTFQLIAAYGTRRTDNKQVSWITLGNSLKRMSHQFPKQRHKVKLPPSCCFGTASRNSKHSEISETLMWVAWMKQPGGDRNCDFYRAPLVF